MAAASSSGSSSLKEYLKRNGYNSVEDKKKTMKKKKVQSKPDATGLLVVDEDPVWQKTVNLEEENSDDSADEDKPQVNEDIEVKWMRRLEYLRARRPYHAISEDGSGWVSLSPKRLDSNDPNSDMSPPRKQRIRNDTPSPSPEQKASDSGRDYTERHHDMSPPRKQRVRNDSPSPEPGVKPSTDLSPPRQRQKRHYAPSPSPDTKAPRSTSLNSDISPPRQRQILANNDRKKHKTADLPDISPPRRGHHGSPYQDDFRAPIGSDLSPPRKSRKDLRRPWSPDLSPPRRRSTESNASRASLLPDHSPPRKSQKKAAVEEQRKTGLISGQDIREEIAKTKKNDWLGFNEMDPSVSGQGAELIYHDKKGARLLKEEFLKLQNKVKMEEKPKEKTLEWGKGLAQKWEAEAKLQELELEKGKSFARTRDDPELNNMLKDRLRWGDPMAHLVKKKHPELVLLNLGDSEKMKESGFAVPQDIPNNSWLKRGIDAPPNRYGIRLGRHWDGVFRSKMNEKRATEMEAYLWSVSDM
ncbi:BUD13 homolog [Fagus crenata]